jgi:hypothetical protein
MQDKTQPQSPPPPPAQSSGQTSGPGTDQSPPRFTDWASI